MGFEGDGVADGGVGVDVEAPLGGRFKEGFEMDALPFTCPVAGTDPNDLTPSDFTAGVEAGEEDMGAETSSIDPKVTGEPDEDHQ